MSAPRWTPGQCQRSGKVMPLNELVWDGAIPGIQVAPEWYEPPHPQERLEPLGPPAIIEHPAPRHDSIDQTITFPLYDVTTGKKAAQLFEPLPYSGDMTHDSFKVALLDQKPGNFFEGAALLEPEPAHVLVANGAMHLPDTVWQDVTVYPTWALMFNAETGEGLLKVNLASPQGCVNGTLAIQWSGMVYATDGQQITGIKIAG